MFFKAIAAAFVLLVLLSVRANPAVAATPVSWANPVSGSWFVSNLWSPAVVPRNNTPPGARYDVMIDALGPSYAIDANIASVVELDSLTLTSPNARFNADIGDFRIGTLTVGAGTFNAATLSFARISIAPTARFSARYLDNVTFVGQANVGLSPDNFVPSLHNGLHLENADLRLPGAYSSTTQSISGNGTVTFTGSGGLYASSTLTIGQQITFQADPSSATRGFNAPVINQGTLALVSGNSIRFDNLSNAGAINMTGGTIMLLSPALLQNPGQFSRAGGTLIFEGVYDMGAGSVDLATSNVGPVQLADAWLLNGTLVSPGSVVQIRRSTNVNHPRTDTGLTNVAIAADLHVNQNAAVSMGNSPLVGTTISLAQGASLYTSSLVGSGTVTFDDNNLTPARIISVGGPASLAIGAGITVRANGNGNFISATNVTNDGTILVDGAVNGVARDFFLPALVNNGTVQVSNGAVLKIQPDVVNNGAIIGANGVMAFRGNLTPASLQPYQLTNPVLAIAGTFSTSSSSLSVSNPQYRLGLSYGGRISNVTLVGNAGDALVATAPSFLFDSAGTLENVVAGAGISVSRMHVYTSGLINNSHVQLTGGRIVLDGQWANNGSISATSASTVAIQRFQPSLGAISLNASTLTITDAVVNAGTLTTSVLDTVAVSNATISLNYGFWDNRDRTLTSNANSATIRVNGGTLLGGRLEAIGGSAFAIGAATLDSVTLAGAGTIGTLPTSITGGRLTLDAATISLLREVPSGVLRTMGETVIDGTGDFIAYHQNFPVAALQAVNGTLTIGEDIRFRTGNAAPFFTGGGSLSSVVNRGEVYCDYPFQAGGTTQLPRFANLGLLEVGSAATFSIDSTTVVGNLNNRTLAGGRWLVQGSLEFGSSSSTISFDTNAAEVHLIGPASRFKAANSLLNNAGTFAILNGRNFTSVGSLSNSGTFVIGSGSTLKTNGTLANTGTVNVNGSLLIDYASGDPSPRSVLEQQIANARHDGAWNQPGLTSTAAKAAFPRNRTLGLLEGGEYRSLVGPGATFGGLTFDDSSVLVKSTYYGDTDFNGVVDFDDYSRIDTGFNNGLTGWFHGDFDYNNQIDFDDYALIDLAFNTQNGTILRAMSYLDGNDASDRGMDTAALRLIELHYTQFGDRYASSFLNAVPEPSSVLILTGVPALAGMSCRLRRRKPTTRALA